ncbi:hypothetical protein C8Q80DRAFT_898326 [Daedaleopsis nitida]|nr:hypothetical protein C8Q80DRAFT_898326 [Daedaleopsis nitida]
MAYNPDHAVFSFSSLPDITQCTPALITWSGGTPPFQMDVERMLPAGTDIAVVDSIVALIPIEPDDRAYTWTPRYPGGTTGKITITDSTSDTVSADFLVSDSADTSCLDFLSQSSDSLHQHIPHQTSSSNTAMSQSDAETSWAYNTSTHTPSSTSSLISPSSMTSTVSGNSTSILSASTGSLSVSSTTAFSVTRETSSSTINMPSSAMATPTLEAHISLSKGAVAGLSVGCTLVVAALISALYLILLRQIIRRRLACPGQVLALIQNGREAHSYRTM